MRAQKTTCSYLTGTVRSRQQGIHTRKEKLTIFREEIVCSSNDKLVDLLSEFLELRVSKFDLLVRRTAVSTFDNRILVEFVEFVLRSEITGITEAQQREVLGEIVLRNTVNDKLCVNRLC